MRSLRRKIIHINLVEFLTLEAYTNLRKCGKYVLLATCDEELLGKTLTHGKLVFKVKEEFYKGPKMPVADAVELMKESTIVNMVGANIVKKAIEAGLVHPEAVLEISGVPHAQIVKM
jgi:hypothetical protein